MASYEWYILPINTFSFILQSTVLVCNVCACEEKGQGYWHVEGMGKKYGRKEGKEIRVWKG